MRQPQARGRRSSALLQILGAPGNEPVDGELLHQVGAGATSAEPLSDEDLQLSLLVLYELHYRGVQGVDERWEWHPQLLGARAQLEAVLEEALRRAGQAYRSQVDSPPCSVSELAPGAGPSRRDEDAGQVMQLLLQMTAPSSKPGLSSHLARHGTKAQYRELFMHRSIYHLKEADPHTWGIPRLSGGVKAALVEIQSDEYGNGRAEWVHARMFADSMEAAGLDARYGHYVDQVPATTLAVLNAMSMFGLHRRLRGALVGHLAAFEMTSTLPNRLYAQGLRRLGYPDAVAAYFDEHVEADAVHEQIALRDLAGALVHQEPDLGADVVFGATTALVLDDLAGAHLLASWQAGRSSLRHTAAALKAS